MTFKLLDGFEFGAIVVGGTCIVGYRRSGPDWIRQEYFLATVLEKCMNEGMYYGTVKVRITGRFAIEFPFASTSAVLNVLNDVSSEAFSSYDSIVVYLDTPSTRQLLRDLLLTEHRRQETQQQVATIKRFVQDAFVSILRDGFVGSAIKEIVQKGMDKLK